MLCLSAVKRQLTRFFANKEASVAPMLAVAALPLISAVGAAIDFGRASSARAAMQAALDAATILMAKDAKNVDADQLTSNALQYFNANFQNAEISGLAVTASSSSTSGGYSASATASGSIKTRFMGIIGFSELDIATKSAALSKSDGLGCVLSLNKHSGSATAGQGSTAVVLDGCSLYDNSDSTTALSVGGSAHITAYSAGVVGNVTGASNITTTQGIRTGMGEVYDPYVDSSFPVPGACTSQNFKAKDTITIDPGVYCDGISLNAGANVTLNPGIYYLDCGNLSVNGGATLSGSEVTLVFTSKNRSSFATASINGNATINLTPPKTGSTAGIVMFGDRNMPVGTAFKFNGGVTQYLGGAVYLPKGAVDFSGGVNSGTNCTQLIGDTVSFTGNSGFSLNCKSYGTKPFSPNVVKLTS
jgi:hypothetical protein